ncbi:MAG: flagellar hook-basal body complex protein FliE [Agathobacter sp.]|nr:flagellar hook-basal body complex protein FliE [Agathobacter sp.]
MDIASLNHVSSDYLRAFEERKSPAKTDGESFGAIFDAMMQHLNETNDLQQYAQAEEIKFALGESENTHDLMIAASKANIALQYTVAVRDRLIEGYNQIMQMQV